MKLEQLITGLEHKQLRIKNNPSITNVTSDSRQVEKGSLFCARSGLQVDGHRFIDDAVNKGAVCIVAQNIPDHIATDYMVVEDSAYIFGQLSARIHGHPSRRMKLVGITGTNGKTSVTFLVEAVFQYLRRKCGVLGTINYRYLQKEFSAPHTTPEVEKINRMLVEMADAKVETVVMEVSSHAIKQQRVAGLDFRLAAFTNLSQDHLDYHSDMEEYFQQKERLFSQLLPASKGLQPPLAVLNVGNRAGRRILKTVSSLENSIRPKVITYGIETPIKDVDVSAHDCSFSEKGIRAKVQIAGREYPFKSPLMGKCYLENLLCAMAICCGLGLEDEQFLPPLSTFRRVPGRMDRVENKLGINLVVDYAHTPDALAQAIETLKSITAGRLLVLFGCGGDRDRDKRPKMGKISTQGAEVTILTNDNSRTEESREIIEDICKGISSNQCPQVDEKDINTITVGQHCHLVIIDRRQAIYQAVESMRAGDTLLVAGKGHENYQLVGEKRYHFDDREEIVKAIGSNYLALNYLGEKIA